MEGTLVRVTPDTLALQVDAGTVVPLARTSRQIVAVQRRTSRVRSAVWSALVWNLAAGVIADQANASERSLFHARLGGTIGGAVLGALRPPLRWRRVTP